MDTLFERNGNSTAYSFTARTLPVTAGYALPSVQCLTKHAHKRTFYCAFIHSANAAYRRWLYTRGAMKPNSFQGILFIFTYIRRSKTSSSPSLFARFPSSLVCVCTMHGTHTHTLSFVRNILEVVSCICVRLARHLCPYIYWYAYVRSRAYFLQRLPHTCANTFS